MAGHQCWHRLCLTHVSGNGNKKASEPCSLGLQRTSRLTLADTKTGPRHVLLGEVVREVLDGLAEAVSGEWVFPVGVLDQGRDTTGVVADVRLHDLRHAYASHAVMNSESLHVAGRLGAGGPPRRTATSILTQLH